MRVDVDAGPRGGVCLEGGCGGLSWDAGCFGRGRILSGSGRARSERRRGEEAENDGGWDQHL